MFCLMKHVLMMKNTNCQHNAGNGIDTEAIHVISRIGYKKCANRQVLVYTTKLSKQQQKRTKFCTFARTQLQTLSLARNYIYRFGSLCSFVIS